MRRCPECGFRADDQICPLCGVRMQHTGASIKTHTHQQQGEYCTLTNKETPKRDTHYHPENSRRKKTTTPSGFVIAVVVIVLISMLRSCIGVI